MKRNRSFFFKSIIISLCALICIYCFAPFVFGATYPDITVQYDTVLEGASSVDPTTSYTFLAEYFYITDNNSSTNTVEESLGYSIESVTSTGSRTVATMTGSMTTSTGTSTNMVSRTFYLGSASPNVGDIVYSDKSLSTQSGYVISSASRYVSITIPDTVPTHPGATFTGWSENASGSGTLYNAGDVFKTYKRTSGKITTLYATWEYIDFPINLEFNGGEIIEGEIPSEYNMTSDDIFIPNPEKFGYEFAGWSDGTDEKEPIFDLTIPSGSFGDVEYYALWEPLTYNITYDLDGGENDPDNPDTYAYSEEELVFINNPYKDGYEFAGWVFYDGDEPYVIEEYVIENGMSGDIELVASWEIINYDIILDLGDGEIEGAPNPETYTVEDDDITITNPVRNGYDFAGWTSESGEMEPVLTLIIPFGSTGTQEFYATWTPAQYSITYILNGGENNADNSEEYTFSVEQGFSIANPTRTGYEFKGWLAGEETEAVMAFEIEPGYYGDITLEATWEAIEYNIEYDLKDGEWKEENPFVYTVEDEINLASPIRTGYTFLGWTGTDLGNDPVLNPVVNNGSIGDREYTANWEAIDYNISYDLGGGTNDSSNPSKYTIETNAITIKSPTRTGYTFLGWTGTDLGNDPVLNPVVNNGSIGDREYTANWEAIDYNISYDLGGGTNSSSNTSVYTIEDNSITIKNPSRTGYTFLGWTGTDLGDSPVIEPVISSGSIGDRAYTAHWEVNVYKITYNLGGGENDSSNPASYTIEDEDITLNIPTRTGYTFLGWTRTGIENNPVARPVIRQGSVGDREYTANWEVNVYEIEYDLDGGSLENANPSTYTVEDEIVFNNPTKYSHEFTGWSNGGTIEKGSIGNVSVKANWTCLHFDTEIRGYKSATTEADGYTGDTYCLVCGNRIAIGEVKPMIVIENIDIEHIDELFDENIDISSEQKQALTQLAEKDIAAVMEIVGAVNKSANSVKESYLNGDITKEEYEEALEKIQAITDSAIELCSNKEEGIEKGNNLNNVIPKESGIDIGSIFGLFYQRQIDILLGKSVVTPVPVLQLAFGGENTNKEEIDLSYSLETYQNVQNFVDDTLDKMTDAALMLRSCSGGTVTAEVKFAINTLAAKTFRDFDKEKADNEFVENAYNAILATVQERVLAALDETYANQVKSGNFTGTAMDDLKKEYQEQYDACSDITQFELMVIEVMRLKYNSVFDGRLSKGLITRDEYNQAMTKSTSLEVFEPVYKEIFRAWALNEESEYGITLSELSDATIETTTKKVGVEKPVLTKLTSKEITFFASFGAAFAALALCLTLSKRKEDSYGG